MTQRSPTDHAAYMQDMFARIAAQYDVMNRLITFGQDQRWRRFVIRQAHLSPGEHLLDIATGTGDIAFEARRQIPDLHVIAADFTLPMMYVGQQRALQITAANPMPIAWHAADTLRLPYADQAFDAVTSGYLFRNLTDIPRALAEQARVLKPGGWLVTLDTTPPSHNFLRPLIRFHLKFIIPTLGRIITRQADAYRYLPESTLGFKSADELAALMRQAGLVTVGYQRFMFGTMAVHWGQKPGPA